MAETMVEKVSRAIYEELEGPVNNQDFKRQMAQWERCLKAARAAIEAMREPTDAMVYAADGHRDGSGCIEGHAPHSTRGMLVAAIDAALNEEAQNG